MKAILTVAALALALAGCSRQGPTPPEQISAEENYVEPAPAPPPAEEPPPPAVNTVEVNLAEPEPEPIDPSEQTLDDADATGLTTRATPNAEDEDAPVDSGAEGESGRE